MRPRGTVPRARWLATVTRSPHATFFHTPQWAELMVAGESRLEPRAEAFELDDGVLAVLPVLGYPTEGGLRGGESMVPGVYGGPVAEREIERDEIRAIVDRARGRRTSELLVNGNPRLAAFRVRPDSATETTETTQTLDLRNGARTALERWHATARRQLRQAERAALEITRATTAADFDAYLEVHARARARWAERALVEHPPEIFRAMQKLADPGLALWLARLDGRVVAGQLWVSWNGHRAYWHGATDPAHSKTFPALALFAHAIGEAERDGLGELDLMPSGGLDGVRRWKAGLGANDVPYRHEHRGPSPEAVRWIRLRKRLRRFARRILGSRS